MPLFGVEDVEGLGHQRGVPFQNAGAVALQLRQPLPATLEGFEFTPIGFSARRAFHVLSPCLTMVVVDLGSC